MTTRRAFLHLLALCGLPPAAAAAQGRPFSFDAIRHLEIDGYRLAYRDMGAGRPMVFLHGNPTSSFLWRNIMPAFAGAARCLAPDLLGMGHSSKARPGDDHAYTFAGQRRLLDQWFERLGIVDRVVLVVHDWGSVLGFDWARRHAEAVAGIVHMEAFVEPLLTATTPPVVVEWFARFRTDEGTRAVLDENHFVERILLAQLPGLTEAERQEYRAPFRRRGRDRLPTLMWPRQVPIDGSPRDVHDAMDASWRWMARTPVPKLFIDAEPGAMVVRRRREIARKWPNTTEATVRAGHFVPEQAATAVVEAIRRWLPSLTRQTPPPEPAHDLANVVELRIVDEGRVYLRSLGALDRVSPHGALVLDRFFIDARTGGVRAASGVRDAREITLAVGERAVQNAWNTSREFQLIEVSHGEIVVRQTEVRRDGRSVEVTVVVQPYAR